VATQDDETLFSDTAFGRCRGFGCIAVRDRLDPRWLLGIGGLARS
jgi:hypothetical protein